MRERRSVHCGHDQHKSMLKFRNVLCCVQRTPYTFVQCTMAPSPLFTQLLVVFHLHASVSLLYNNLACKRLTVVLVKKQKTCTMFLVLGYRNMYQWKVGRMRNVVGTQAAGEQYFHSFFEFSQTFANVSVYNSIETQRTCYFSISFRKHCNVKKGKKTC